jgi:hypothetical protein
VRRLIQKAKEMAQSFLFSVGGRGNFTAFSSGSR